ncbi:MAG: PrsW family intramembrane metalloprotease [Candidatus Wildermuthbacteria bacterium]|nr:PrsW family intramembrane metalloprotease [Candidatus Wildermuthbacteria bacterium]
MTIFWFVVFGLVPSFAWLAYYLRKDRHPEPNIMIVKVFAFGGAGAMFAHFAEPLFAPMLRGLTRIVQESFSLSPDAATSLFYALYFFFAVALLEELLKYFAVRVLVYPSEELDEPIDLMLYMIIAALGFAGVENILKFFELGANPDPSHIVLLSAFRFAGATFLHALASGLFGYALVVAWYGKKSHALHALAGLLVATVAHTLFNFSLIRAEHEMRFLYPAAILIVLTTLLSLAFLHVKKIKSICEIHA